MTSGIAEVAKASLAQKFGQTQIRGLQLINIRMMLAASHGPGFSVEWIDDCCPKPASFENS